MNCELLFSINQTLWERFSFNSRVPELETGTVWSFYIPIHKENFVIATINPVSYLLCNLLCTFITPKLHYNKLKLQSTSLEAFAIEWYIILALAFTSQLPFRINIDYTYKVSYSKIQFMRNVICQFAFSNQHLTYSKLNYVQSR